METLTETIDVIHIDALNRTIKMKSISKDASMYCDELGLSRINEDESSFTIRRHAGKADIFAGQLLPVPHGFILYLRGETYVVNGSGYIHAQEVLPNTDLGDEDISTTLPLDYVIEGHGPVEGKMVVQFFAPMPKHEVNGDREILAAVDGFFGDDNRYDEVTLYSGITNELTDILGVLANHDPDKANYHSATIRKMSELLRDLFDAYQLRKYGTS